MWKSVQSLEQRIHSLLVSSFPVRSRRAAGGVHPGSKLTHGSETRLCERVPAGVLVTMPLTNGMVTVGGVECDGVAVVQTGNRNGRG
ncbi:hypothetical protein [Mycolicibacterium sphagni]|uniref:hypothetical protein n=1 Tax=Mycolicibacterium sphagni TaxID=1786 RepID=UPI001055C39D|nr:hypothetical protein [Mycolicibacterium sphagni]